MAIPTTQALTDALDLFKQAIIDGDVSRKNFIDDMKGKLEAKFSNDISVAKSEVLAEISNVSDEAVANFNQVINILDNLDGTEDGEINAKTMLSELLTKTGANETEIARVDEALNNLIDAYNAKMDELDGSIANLNTLISNLKSSMETAIAEATDIISQATANITVLQDGAIKLESLWNTLIDRVATLASELTDDANTRWAIE